ncbi:MAG: aminoglycoside phosphotransferase family protein [Sulfitobacter sp.]
MTERSAQASHFIAQSGWDDSRSVLLAGDASNRRYDRLTKPTGETAIFMDAPPDRGEDVRPFVRIANYLKSVGLSAPEIFHQDADAGFLLIEDLGDALFARMMATDPTSEEMLYRAATELLIDLHAARPLDLPLCNAVWLTEMTEPVFEWYVQTQTSDIKSQFREVFYSLAERLDAVEKVTILRDFHAENLLWLPDRNGTAKVGILDFQDALLGHPAYDLVSILQDARRDVSPELEASMITYYLNKSGAQETEFRAAYALLGAQRNLRILGIFARLCLRDGKAHYIDFIPRVWEYIIRNLAHPSLASLADLIKATLPYPNAEYMEHLKSQCATTQQPS